MKVHPRIAHNKKEGELAEQNGYWRHLFNSLICFYFHRCLFWKEVDFVIESPQITKYYYVCKRCGCPQTKYKFLRA